MKRDCYNGIYNKDSFIEFTAVLAGFSLGHDANDDLSYSDLPINSVFRINKNITNPSPKRPSIFFMNGKILDKLPLHWSDLINQSEFFCEITQRKNGIYDLRELKSGENFIINLITSYESGNDPSDYHYYKSNIAAWDEYNSNYDMTRFVCYDRKENGKSITPSLGDVKRTFGDFIRIEVNH